KVSLLGHDAPSIDRDDFYLPAHKWWNEGLHGVASTDCCPPHVYHNVTSFPQVIGLAATWNRTLWNEVGGAIGTEALRQIRRAEAAGDDVIPGLTYFTPNINIFRDPRWGRGQETPGEDPYLTSHYAAVMVSSLQYGSEVLRPRLQRLAGGPTEEVGDSGATPPPRRRKPRIAATCKHFAAYSLETSRLNFSANIRDERDWDDTYFPAFEACVRSGWFLREHFGDDDALESGSHDGALGVMCSYNAIDGVPACANPGLLRDKLRDEWGFGGYVVSDCWAVADIYEEHRYARSYEDAVGMALKAGVDLDCGDTMQGYGMKALEEGKVDVADVDRALTRQFAVLMELGYFDDEPEPNAEDESLARRHDELALDAALQSIVLLKNGPDDASDRPRPLPLSLAKHGKIDLVGPLADDEQIPLGNYHGAPSEVIAPLRGLRELGVEASHVRGCNVTGGSDGDDVDAAGDLCERMGDAVDATILIVGLDQGVESEDLDRTSLFLPEAQRDVVEEASRCSKARSPGAPVVLVVVTGGPVDLSSYKLDDGIDAILYASYPGQAGGRALSRVLYGRYNPSGRLVTTIYRNSQLDRVALEDMRMRPEEPSNPDDRDDELFPGRTYRFYNGPVVYPFGHGLSYTSWTYSLATVRRENVDAVSRIVVTVTNSGHVDGPDSVLLFHRGPRAGTKGNPIKSLIGFEKVSLNAGGSQQVTFNVERWMATQKSGWHTFAVGPSMDHTLQIKTSDGGKSQR
ncbi:hypothetical protein ACHAWF_016610, partial [Thalassiosira exigua]